MKIGQRVITRQGPGTVMGKRAERGRREHLVKLDNGNKVWLLQFELKPIERANDDS